MFSLKDSRVPISALVILDVQRVEVAASQDAIIERAHALREQLGPKLGPACAIIVGGNLTADAEIFREVAIDRGLHVAIVPSEIAARDWLSAYRDVYGLKF